MIEAAVVFVYLALVLGIGLFGGRSLRLRSGQAGGPNDAESYFLAGRSLGPIVFLLSLFGTNMTGVLDPRRVRPRLRQRHRDLRA
jgi:Na+/proline symporter